MSDTPMYYVQIRKLDTDEVVKQMGPFDERKADKVESGASINLNHEQFYTMQVSAERVNV